MKELLLQKLQAYSPENENSFASILENWRREEWLPGTIVSNQKLEDCVVFIEKGVLHMGYSLAGVDATIFLASEEDFVLVDKQGPLKAKYFLQAITGCSVWVLNRKEASALFKKYDWFERLVDISLCGKMRNAMQQLLALRLQPVETRYTSFTRRFSHLLPHLPLKIVASYLGIMPQALSRVRRQLNHHAAVA